jgi:hypothetical protein
MSDNYTIHYTANCNNPASINGELEHLYSTRTHILNVINSLTGRRYSDTRIDELAFEKINNDRLRLLMTPGYSSYPNPNDVINVSINHDEKIITITEKFICPQRTYNNSNNASTISTASNNNHRPSGPIGGRRKKTRRVRRKASRKSRR